MKIFKQKPKTGFTVTCSQCNKDGCTVHVKAKAIYGIIDIITTVKCPSCGYSSVWTEGNI